MACRVDGISVGAVSSYTFTNVTYDRTIAAAFVPNPPTAYTITYVVNGGSNPAGAPTTYSNGAGAVLPTPIRAGYIFEGWYESASFAGARVTAISASDTGNKVLYARWTAIPVVTSVSLSGPSSAPTYGGSATLTAHLVVAGGTGLEGQAAVFERWNGPGWISLGTVQTDSAGNAVIVVSGLKTKQTYRVRFAEAAPYYASISAELSVSPKVGLTRPTSWKTLTRNKTYYAKGFIYPKHSVRDSNRVKIRAYKKRSNGKYYYVKSFTAKYSYYSSSKTRYKASVKLTSKGSWKLVAYHAADSKNAKTYGSTDYVKVK